MWVLTEAVNAYDQYGDYFVSVWTNKPSVEQIKKVTNRTEDYIERFILSGEGREYPEKSWYYLTEVEEGEGYQPVLF